MGKKGAEISVTVTTQYYNKKPFSSHFLTLMTTRNFTNLFYWHEQNLTQFVKVLLVKLSEMLDSSIFVKLFHRQSSALYGIMRSRLFTYHTCYMVLFQMIHS